MNAFRTMHAPKSRLNDPAQAAKQPQRERGRLRVSALMQAAADLFAEKGFEGATMTEIAARAGSPIGSLYQFFPSKESLAGALITHYAGNIEAALAAVAHAAPGLSAGGLADRLLDVPVTLKDERTIAMSLLDALRDQSKPADCFRRSILEQVSAILRARAPLLPEGEIVTVAGAVLLAMKTMPVAPDDPNGCAPEWRRMLRAYLADRLGA